MAGSSSEAADQQAAAASANGNKNGMERGVEAASPKIDQNRRI